MHKFIILLSFLILAVMVSCSKDEDNNPNAPGSSEDAPIYRSQSIILPAKMQESTDPHVQSLLFYISMANTYSSVLTANLTPPSLDKAHLSQNNGPWEYHWTEDSLNIAVIIKHVTGTYTWQVIYNGHKGEENYINFIAFRAEQAENEKSGKFIVYVPNTTFIAGEYSWSLDADNALTAEFSTPIANPYGNRFEGLFYKDQSGTLRVFLDTGGRSMLFKRFAWDNQGNGNWWEYENGQVVASGSWN